MVTKIHRDALRSEIGSIRAMLEGASQVDPLGSRSFRKRLKKLETELSKIEEGKRNVANVALVFDGDPVRGSSAIEADFAGKALQNYQDLIANFVAVGGGPLAERGRLSDQIHQQARMNVTALVHGSFGFVLEEDHADQSNMFETPAQKAVQAVTDLLTDVTAMDGQRFAKKLDDLDLRVFQTLKRFVGVLHRAKSTLRVAEEQRELSLDVASVDRAYERMSLVDVEELDEVHEGELLGLVPVQRRFEFRRGDNGELIQGRVAPNLSADYLERVEREGLIAGGNWRSTIRTKTINHPDGRHSSSSRTLIDLVRL
jgi:hypothetical protein